MRRVSGDNDPDGTLRKIGEAIRHVRKAQRLSQEALADSARIDRSHMGRIERGERNVTLLNLKRISDALRLPMSEILRHAEDAA